MNLPKEFYVKATEDNYTKLLFIGLKNAEELDYDYPFICVNNTDEKQEDLDAKSFWFAHRDRIDGLPLIKLEDYELH